MRRASLRVRGTTTGAERIIVDEQKLIAASPIGLEELFARESQRDDRSGPGHGIASLINPIHPHHIETDCSGPSESSTPSTYAICWLACRRRGGRRRR